MLDASRRIAKISSPLPKIGVSTRENGMLATTSANAIDFVVADVLVIQ